ncbi:MAG TPA: DUF4157 domain-containing protein [Solirubrobacteraceae bacterium]|nr:DUF4157 domain-containing protein [Solirubrobacteraceae bacterium]
MSETAEVREDPLRAHSRASPLERAVAGLGNRAFTHVISRMQDGNGILAGGLVHPHIQTAIAASRGSGNPLTPAVSRHLESSYGEPLRDVRVHTGDHAAALARAVSARAFTVGSDIFFGRGEYDPASRAGTELIAHEVAHVVQQRGAAAAGQLRVSQPGDPSEREAEAVARDITR